jgi:hypothetical protein
MGLEVVILVDGKANKRRANRPSRGIFVRSAILRDLYPCLCVTSWRRQLPLELLHLARSIRLLYHKTRKTKRVIGLQPLQS